MYNYLNNTTCRFSNGEEKGVCKMRASILSLAILLGACLATTGAHAMQDDVDQALTVLEHFYDIPEKSIPPAVMRAAKGLAILTMTKAGFIFSARGGKGIVVARTDKGWSGPSGIGTGGIGFGFQAGAQISEYVIVLNTPEAVKAFSLGGNVTLGGALSVAVGPVGRTAEAGVAIQAAMYTYSRSQGAFAGVSLEATVIGTRNEANEKYYGKSVTAKDILAGKVEPPAGARKLLQELSK
jgi:lipid-binding SYLF domain-containing protein